MTNILVAHVALKILNGLDVLDRLIVHQKMHCSQHNVLITISLLAMMELINVLPIHQPTLVLH